MKEPITTTQLELMELHTFNHIYYSALIEVFCRHDEDGPYKMNALIMRKLEEFRALLDQEASEEDAKVYGYDHETKLFSFEKKEGRRTVSHPRTNHLLLPGTH